MNDNDQDTPLEVMPPSAIMAMEKAQIDQQIATAHQYPRSLEQFKKRALSMATLDPETAESCVYVRPVGKELDKATGRWVEKYAEGPSIRLAEIVAVSFGNLRAASRVVEQTDRYVKCQGMAHDLESNTAMSADCIESTVTRDGKPYSERQRALIAKVCSAKALRDAILKVVPRALCKPILEASKRVAAGADQPLEVRRKKAQAWVGTLKIDETRVFAALGVQGWAEVTSEHLLTLTGLKTAMTDGDETIDSAFPPVAKAPEHTRGPESIVTPFNRSVVDKLPVRKDEKPDKPEKTTSGLPQDAPEGVQIPPMAAKAAVQPPVSESMPSGEPVDGSFESAEPKPASEPAAGQPEAAESVGEPDPLLAPDKNDTNAVASLKLLAAKSGVTWGQLRGWLTAKKLMKPEQKTLNELAGSKVDALLRTWPAKLPEIRSV